MEDDQIHAHIEQPVAEEHGLRERGAQGGLSESERSWRESIMVGLDQYWDLLRQRRVLRESGDDPASPRVRELEIVERDAQLAMGRPADDSKSRLVACEHLQEPSCLADCARMHAFAGRSLTESPTDPCFPKPCGALRQYGPSLGLPEADDGCGRSIQRRCCHWRNTWRKRRRSTTKRSLTSVFWRPSLQGDLSCRSLAPEPPMTAACA